MAEARVGIILEAEDRATQTIKNVGGQMSSMKDIAGNLKPAIAQIGAVAGVAFGALSVAIKQSLEEAGEAAKVQAQLGAVLKSTSGAAGLFIEDLNDQSKALQKMTTYSDEAVGSAQALMLTFTNVKGAIFQESISTILDMSTALGQDLKSSAIQVGKALQDPILGVSALRKVGVNFTKDQQEMIKGLVESGKVMEAQKFILKELNTEFGGSASAAAQTFAGRMEQLNNQVNDVKENIGNALIPIVTKLLEAVTPMVLKIADWIEQNPELTRQIIVIATALTGIIAATAGISLLLLALNPVALVLAGIIASLILIGTTIYKLVKDWKYVWIQMKEDMKPVVDFFDKVVQGAKYLGNIKENFGYLISGIGQSVLGSKAEGGYIPQTGNYLMHAGEYVVKADKSNAGQSFVFNFNGDVNDKEKLIDTIKSVFNRQSTLRLYGGQ